MPLPQRLQPPAEVAAAMGVEVDMAAAMLADTEVDMPASAAAAAVGAAATPISPADTFAGDISITAFAASVSGAAGSTPLTATAAGAGIPASTAT